MAKTQINRSKKYLSFKLSGGTSMDSFFTALPNPDRLMEQISLGTYESITNVYDDILNDDHVSTVVELLESGILRHKPFIKSKSKKEKKMYESEMMAKKLNIRSAIKHIVEGSLKGMAVFEIMWRYEEGRYKIDELIAIDIKDIDINDDGDIVYKDTYNLSDEKLKHKFLVYRNKPHKNPYGVATILKCYYPWQFKKAGWRFWLTTTEKYGVPTLVVEYDSAETDNTEDVEEELTSAFFNIENDSVVVANNLKDLHVIDSKAKAVEFKTLIDACEQSISKTIIGTPILTSSGKEGNRALAEVQANINYRYKVQNLIFDISDVLSKLIDFSIELNTASGVNKHETEFGIEYVDIQDFEKMISALDRGIAISAKAFYKHVPMPDGDDDTLDVPVPMNIMQATPDKRNSDDKEVTPETKTETKDTETGND